MIKNVLICGIGAIGSIYAEILNRYGENLRILVDEGRMKKYQETPLVFNGKKLIFNYVLPSETDFKADLIIIATKYDGLNDAIKNIENFVTPQTIIMSLLNGVTSEKIIAAVYGNEKMVHSYFIGHSAMRTGRCVVHDGVNTIVFGSPDNLSNVERIKEFFDKVGINYKIPDDIIRSMWLKYMLNVSSNQVSALLRLTFGDMQNNKKCINLIKDIMQEVVAVAKAEGVKNTDTMIEEGLKVFYTMTKDGKTSMLQDIEAGRKTEVDMFAGVMIDYGKKHGIPTPYNTVLKSLIETIE